MSPCPATPWLFDVLMAAGALVFLVGASVLLFIMLREALRETRR